MSFNSWIMAQLYDWIMKDAEAKCLHEWRDALLSSLSGTLLEIGVGTGANLAFYPQDIAHLILVEPDANMRKKLQQKCQSRSNTKILDCPAESLPLADHSVDVAVSTLVLCSVTNPEQVLNELYRVLRPEGKLIFIEHIAATNNPHRLKWQQRIEPIWKRISCGCHLTRETEQAIIKAGFTLREITHQSLRGTPTFVRPSIKGIAIKSC